MATTTCMISLFLFIFIIFVQSCCAASKNIFVLAGQSNMVGRGNLDELIPERAPDPMILRFAANLTWEVAADPLHGDIDDHSKQRGVGPGMPFAKSVLRMDPNFGLIGLVPCAFGATYIKQWEKGSFLYERMLSRTRAAVKAGGGVIRAILWYQGEADRTPELARVYKSMFQTFINDVRADLQLPSLPIIEVALDFASNNASEPTGMVRKAQLDTAVELRNVRCVDAQGLEIKKIDPVHLTTASQVKLGAMMAQAYLNLTITPAPAPAPAQTVA